MQTPDSGQSEVPVDERHRATYVLELGVWHARCRTCGWVVADTNRRMAASRFRHHIRSAREEGDRIAVDLGLEEAVLDLRGGVSAPAGHPPGGR